MVAGGLPGCGPWGIRPIEHYLFAPPGLGAPRDEVAEELGGAVAICAEFVGGGR